MSRIAPTQPMSSNIALTPNFTTVSTSTGFAQGDMMFWKNGDYQPFSSQASTASFSLTPSAPVMSGVTGGTGNDIGSNLTSTSPSGGNSSARSVATLSNGNIVVAGMSASNTPFFTIYDSSFAVAVSRVTLPTTFTASNNTIGVASLSGGGFVIYFTNNSGYFSYAVYTNTGSVTKALAQNTVATNTTSSPFSVVGLSGGGFVAAAVNSATTSVFYIIFNSGGTQTFSNTGLAAAATAATFPTVVANNANTFFMVWQQTSTTAAWYQISSTNTTLGNGTFNTGNVVEYYNCTATVLGNGTTIAVFYVASTGTTNIGVRSYNSTTYVMGSETAYGGPNSAYGISGIYAKTLASGDVFVCFSHARNDSYYTTFNSSLAPIIAPNSTAATPAYKPISSKYNNSGGRAHIASSMFATELGGVLYAFYSTIAVFGNGNQMYEAIDLTAYNWVPNASISFNAGTTSASVGAYIASTLTPVSVSYYPASSTASLYRTTAFASANTLVNGTFTSNNYDVCTLTNGNVVVAYIDDSTKAVSAKVFSLSGTTATAVTTVSIGTATSGTYYNSVKVTALASGKFVVAYYSGSTEVTCIVVSATYTTATGAVITGVLFNTSSATTNYLALGTLSNDRFAVAWTTTTGGNYYYINIYSATPSVALASITTTTTGFPQDITGMPGGGFALVTGTATLYYYDELTTNTFTLISNTSITAAFPNGAVYRMNVTPKGQLVTYASTCGSSVTSNVNRYLLASRANSAATVDIAQAETTPASTPVVGCELANGAFVWATTNTTATTIYGIGTSNNALTITPQINTPVYIRPVANETCVFLWRATAAGNSLTLAVVTCPVSITSVITAGVTASSSVTITSSTYRFAGVAANTVGAGSTVGVMQTNGAAILNSTYSTAVPGAYFSARDNSSPGISGTINGRNMILYGIGITGTT